MGFTAKAAIHPQQVATINRVFSPDPEQIAWARAVNDAVGGDENAVAVVDGKFVDRPIILRARHILAQCRDS
jgi:citrate lyase beta subunit